MPVALGSGTAVVVERDDTGQLLDVNSWPKTFDFDSNGNPYRTTLIGPGGQTWVRTTSYTNLILGGTVVAKVNGVSAWIKQ